MNKLRLIALVCIMMASTMLSAFAQDYRQVENICYRSTCDAYQAERCILDVYLLAPYSGQAVTHYEQRRLMGMSELIPLVDELAPMHHMRPGLPPMLIISGDRELELFGRYEEQAYFWRMLRLNGNQNVYLYELQGYDHGAMASPAHHILKQYINKHL